MGLAIVWIALAAVAAFIIWKWVKRRQGREEPQELLERAAAPHVEGDGSFDFDIVGEGAYQKALDQIAGGKTKTGHELERLATLIREPENPHDTNAIAVIIEGSKVGYIARAEAKAIAKMMDRVGNSQFTADALIVGGWIGKDGEGHFGVRLDLPS